MLILLVRLMIVLSIAVAATVGGYVSDYLDYGVGARSFAMGGAMRTLFNGADTGFYNPALLPETTDTYINTMSTNLPGETAYTYFGILSPFMGNDIYSLNYTNLGASGYELHTTTLPEAEPNGSFDVNNGSLMLSYGKKINRNLNVGATVKYGYRSVYLSKDSVFTTDVGWIYNLDFITLGGTIRNLFSLKMGDETADEYELDVDMGASMVMMDEKLVVAVDVGRLMRKSITYYVGAEYEAYKTKDNTVVKARAGLNSDELSAGIGYSMAPLVFDYAYVIGSIENRHIFSMGFYFEDLVFVDKKVAVQTIGSIASKIGVNDSPLLQSYVNEKLSKSLEESKVDMLKADVNNMLALGSGRVYRNDHLNKLMKVAVDAYLNKEYQKAFEHAEYLVRNYDNQEVRDFRQMIEENSNGQYRYKNQSVLNRKFERIQDLLMRKDFKSAEKGIRGMLYYDPNNLKALKKLATLYYDRGDTRSAEIWRRILEIDPNDRSAKIMLDSF
jgi:tetratricopeptide (TPR) repeat protein